MADTRLIFRVQQDLKQRLELLAWQQRISASELLRQITEDYLDKKEGKKEEVETDYLRVPF